MTVIDSVVNHGAVDRTIGAERIDRQVMTAEALRRRLDDHGGVILGDEVGSGKTYVTFALLVTMLAQDPQRGAVIFVPSEPLKNKWCEQLREYIRTAVRDAGLKENLSARIVPIDRSLRNDGSLEGDRFGEVPKRNSIVVATHKVYSFKTSESDRAACLRAAARTLESSHPIRHRYLLRACGIDPDCEERWAMWARTEVLDEKTLRPLQNLLDAYVDGHRNLEDEASVAIQGVRRLVGRALLPDCALVVIDEAHHMKSTGSTVYRSLQSVLARKFDALLFLTATPFQLGRDELLNIVDFFRWSRGHDEREDEFEQRIDALRTSMDGWIASLDDFIRIWTDLSAEQAENCVRLIEDQAGPAGDDALERRGAAGFRDCLGAKGRLEDAMRPFLVRSVRDRNHCERGAVEEAFLTEETKIPLALVDRLLVERMQGSRTFISSALVSACSSWPALTSAAIMSEENKDSRTRPVLDRLARQDLLGKHPKVEQTVDSCAQGIASGEKTLVFVERQQTGHALRDQLKDRIDTHVDQGEGPSDAALLQRLQDRTRFGWPSLRENYLHTIYPLVFRREPQPSDLQGLMSQQRWRDLWMRVDPDQEKRDYGVEKRFWEHVLFSEAVEGHPGWRDDLGGPLRESVEHLLQAEYILNGLDMVSGDTEVCREVPDRPLREQPREPRMPFAEAFVAYPSPWEKWKGDLAALEPVQRAAFVDSAASAIAISHFRQELAREEIESEPKAHFDAMKRLLSDPDKGWPRRFGLLAEKAREAVQVENQEIADHRLVRLIEALGQENRVQYVDGGTATGTKENAVDGFNTPLYPEVIITTEVLAEGLDLHRSCRRVIHHDLPWNPAKLEQRTGRVDRVGSLSEQLQDEGRPDYEINVWLPFVPGTYDQFVYERVMARRREFRCILGNRPEWQDESLGDGEVGVPLDESLVKQLQVNLSPTGT